MNSHEIVSLEKKDSITKTPFWQTNKENLLNLDFKKTVQKWKTEIFSLSQIGDFYVHTLFTEVIRK